MNKFQSHPPKAKTIHGWASLQTTLQKLDDPSDPITPDHLRSSALGVSEFNAPFDTLYVILETVSQAITCTGNDETT